MKEEAFLIKQSELGGRAAKSREMFFEKCTLVNDVTPSF